MKANFERSWKERLIMKIYRLALLAASVHRAEGESILSVLNPRSLTNMDTGMGVPDPSGKKQSQGSFSPNCEIAAFSKIDQ